MMTNIIKNKLILMLTFVAINSTINAMMTTVSQQAPAIGRAAAPAIGAMMPSILANYNREYNSPDSAESNEYNFTHKYSPAGKSQSTMPNLAQQYTNQPYSQSLMKQQITAYQNAQAHQGPIVNFKQAFTNDQDNENSYNPWTDQELGLDSMDETPTAQPQLKKLNPNISIAQNSYGRNSDFGKSLFTIQQRNYSTFKPEHIRSESFSENIYHGDPDDDDLVDDWLDNLKITKSTSYEDAMIIFNKFFNEEMRTSFLFKNFQNDAYEKLKSSIYNELNRMKNPNYTPIDTFKEKELYKSNSTTSKELLNKKLFNMLRDTLLNDSNKNKKIYTTDKIESYIKKYNIDINELLIDDSNPLGYNFLGVAMDLTLDHFAINVTKELSDIKLDIIKLAIKLGADVNTNGITQETALRNLGLSTYPLLNACNINNMYMTDYRKNLITTLLQANPNVNIIDCHNGNNPLLALITNDVDHPVNNIIFIKDLIKRGIDVNHANKKGETPLSKLSYLSLTYKENYKNILKKDPTYADSYKLRYKVIDECAEMLIQAGAQKPIDNRSTWEKIKQNWF